MIKTLKVRLYPEDQQMVLLEKHFGKCAFGKCYSGGTLKRRPTSCHSMNQELPVVCDGEYVRNNIIGNLITGLMTDRLAEVEISKDGDIYLARITLPSGEVVNLENDQFEDILEQIANDLGERFSN
ncbi:MAG: helix-turn-helix domain-containing protein [Candidatus Thermoplasmatota archaeon]|nr:helix-turn-helix domain-containing protein [Candidatus Thermoplasmatota archaeon]